MEKIKTKNVIKGTIKKLDKGSIVAERTKDNIVNIKSKVENISNNDNNVNEYGSNKIKFISNRIADESISKFNSQGKQAVSTTKNNIIKTKNSIKTIKQKIKRKNQIKKIKHNIKTGKVAFQKSNNIIKNTKVIGNKNIKKVKRAKKVVKGVKQGIKVAIATVKAIIAATKALISALIAGGWVVVLIILIVCLVAYLCSSIYGIFFSNEDVNSDYKLSEIVEGLNKELYNKIDEIKDSNDYDDYKINSNRAEWKDMLAIYVVKTSGNNKDALILTEEKKEQIQEIFWDMTSLEDEVKLEDEKNILYININGKTKEEMMNKYKFTQEQREQVKTLLESENNSLWTSVIYGIDYNSSSIVNIALSQVGNVGGEPYWKWYGYKSRVEWCAVFVSWVANQLGYIDANIIPKFVACLNGVNWFKDRGQWKEADYIPKEGDIIFFDWEEDDSVDHVGIVVKVDNNKIYTVEGNSTDDTCRKQEYKFGSKYIFGYGVPSY